MCGIVGVLQYKSKIPREIRAKALSLLFSETMINTQPRGADATGLFQVHNDGDWMLAKHGERVSRWLLREQDGGGPVIYRDFLNSWREHPRDLSAIIGHCRKATTGSSGGNNQDNHPFALQVDALNALLGVHNGTLDNHEVIFRKLPTGLERQGKTDSEVIFHFLWHLTERGQVPFNGEILGNLGKKLDGSFACVVVNSKFPNLVATFRDGRPLEFIMVTPLNIVIIVSDRAYAKSALESYERYRNFGDRSLPELLWDDRSLPDRDWRILDTSLEFPTGKPCFQDLNKISHSNGAIKPFHHAVSESWRSKPTPTTGTNPNYTKPQGLTSVSGEKTATTATAKVSKTPAIPAKAGVNNKLQSEEEPAEAEVVEVAIEEETAVSAFENVRSLGLCPNLESETDVAAAIGRTNLLNISVPRMATEVGKAFFGLGYATCLSDKKQEVEKVRRRGRELAPKLEVALGKQQRAQQRIWNQKQLILLLLSLGQAGYSLKPGAIGVNVTQAIKYFPKLSEESRRTIGSVFAEILSDPGSQTTLRSLKAAYKALEEAREQQDNQSRVRKVKTKHTVP